MDALQSEDGQHFIRSLAQFIRQHEKALANSLQLSVHKRQPSTSSSPGPNNITASIQSGANSSSSSSSLAATLSFAGLNFMAHSVKAAHLTLTAHHLFYVLSRVEELEIAVGPMNVRLENLNNDTSPTNYVSFLQTRKIPPKGRSDRDSIHSVSSVRSVMSGMSAFWSSIGLGSSISRTERAKAATESDLKYLYSAFTKLPSLRLTSDHRARLIKGYEEFPFDTAVPLFAFKNIQQLEIVDVDFRHFHGWDRLADQLCLLTVKRANLNDPAELLTHIVLDDAEKRRRRSQREGRASPPMSASWTVPTTPRAGYAQSPSGSDSPVDGSPDNDEHALSFTKDRLGLSGSVSPKRPSPSRPTGSHRHVRSHSARIIRSGSGSSYSSDVSARHLRSESASNLLAMNTLPASKWLRLKYLSLADNSLTSISAKSLAPLTTTLRSLNLASNLFTQIPDSLASLTRLTSLDLSNCMIDSLQSLLHSPLPAITTLKLNSNRLQSLAGIERLPSLEYISIQDNQLTDPMEMARLTGMPNLRRIWVKQNPFTRVHANYRVTIFNVFRSTPGYVEDMIIDDAGPSYAERKLLVERAPEIERVVSRPSLDRPITPVIVNPTEHEMYPPQDVSEVGRASTRRRKPPRRRIVDLARDDTMVLQKQLSVNRTAVKAAPSCLDSPFEEKSQHTSSSRPTSQDGPGLSEPSDIELDTGDTVPGPSTPTNATHEEYRAKIEALRQEFGSQWLRALGDQDWHKGHHDSDEHRERLSESSLHRGDSQTIINPGRSLG